MGLAGGANVQLWVMCQGAVAVFMVHKSRSAAALAQLMGDSEALVVSDRFSAYRKLGLQRRQFCWSHLLRDFEALAQCDGERGRVGRTLTELTRLMFALLRWIR